MGKLDRFMNETSVNLAETVEFAENPDPRCACVLLLDTSGSMQGEPIRALNEGLRTFCQELNKDHLARRRVEVAVVTFDDTVNVLHDFMTADQFRPPELQAGGATCMGTGILKALEMVRQRKSLYRTNGIAYYRPWVFLITDGEPLGEPQDVVARAAQQVRDEEDHHRVVVFGVGVREANMEKLSRIVVRPPIKLPGLSFNELFVWLSKSTQAVSKAEVADQVALPPPGWTSA